jgi:hypothetical protein
MKSGINSGVSLINLVAGMILFSKTVMFMPDDAFEFDKYYYCSHGWNI